MQDPRKGPIEDQVLSAFEKKGITTFQAAANFIESLAFKRTSNKRNLMTVLKENRGTCSSKHSLLYAYSKALDMKDVQLILGFVKLNPRRFPNDISYAFGDFPEMRYLPEAHVYLKIKGEFKDYSGISSWFNYPEDLIEEHVMDINKIVDNKEMMHLQYLEQFLKKERLPYKVGDVWDLRQNTIRMMSNMK